MGDNNKHNVNLSNIVWETNMRDERPLVRHPLTNPWCKHELRGGGGGVIQTRRAINIAITYDTHLQPNLLMFVKYMIITFI